MREILTIAVRLTISRLHSVLGKMPYLKSSKSNADSRSTIGYIPFRCRRLVPFDVMHVMKRARVQKDQGLGGEIYVRHLQMLDLNPLPRRN